MSIDSVGKQRKKKKVNSHEGTLERYETSQERKRLSAYSTDANEVVGTSMALGRISEDVVRRVSIFYFFFVQLSYFHLFFFLLCGNFTNDEIFRGRVYQQ